MSDVNRTESRGRDREFISTGRGGAGNAVRSPSRTGTTTAPHPYPGIDPTLQAGSERGRTISTTNTTNTNTNTHAAGGKETSLDRIIHTGRGGAGNTRSPSKSGRDEARREEQLEERMVAERRGRELLADAPYSTGRGGAGNMNSSRSRSRSRQPSLTRSSTSGPNQPHAAGPLHNLLHGKGGKNGSVVSGGTGDGGELSKTTSRSSSNFMGSGRGGYGNMIHADQMSPEQRAQFEAEKLSDAQILSRYRSVHPHEIHSSGRGGGGNLAAPLATETEARMAAISLEDREARDKVDAESARLGRTTGHGGIGNYQPAAPIVEVDEEGGGRGRQDANGGGGMMRKVLRSMSRQSGTRDRSAVRS